MPQCDALVGMMYVFIHLSEILSSSELSYMIKPRALTSIRVRGSGGGGLNPSKIPEVKPGSDYFFYPSLGKCPSISIHSINAFGERKKIPSRKLLMKAL